MACEQSSNRISRFASQMGAGIAQLANKRAFYAGVGLGGAGLLGAGLMALARWRNRRQNNQGEQSKTSQSIRLQSVPQLSPRLKIKPAPYVSSSERCAGCQTSSQSKQGGWYSINGRSYCQDCAPDAARQADADLVGPEREAAGTGAVSPAGQSVPKARIPVRHRATAAWSPPTYLPPERRIDTRLAESRLRLNVGQDPNGQPVWFVVENGRVLLRSDGSDTGLAVTPALKIGPLRDGVQEVEEDTGRWWLTHIPSGKTLGSRPYSTPEEAQLLGNVLAQLDWTRPEHEITDYEIGQVAETVRHYNQALAEQIEMGRVRVDTASGEASRPAVGSTRRPGADEDLTGKLMADGYGGVARVLDTTQDGEILFVVDSLGKRYEVRRDQIRTPDASDFEMCRVAMSFDPAKEAETHANGAAGTLLCARCGQSPRSEDRDKWYRMGGKPFCSSCATAYAAEEGYIKDEEIDSNLESI